MPSVTDGSNYKVSLSKVT